ncbi:MAG: hypothetical protein GY862_08425 [Gammaproteobacteria bacterium]|nr:hypothetical protein [Gammaproteobacteria bacterium]
MQSCSGIVILYTLTALKQVIIIISANPALMARLTEKRAEANIQNTLSEKIYHEGGKKKHATGF